MLNWYGTACWRTKSNTVNKRHEHNVYLPFLKNRFNGCDFLGCCTCPELLHAEKERVLEKYTNYYAWKCAKVKQPKIHRYRNVHGIISIFQTIPSEGSACMRVCNKTATYFTYMLDDFAMSYSLCSLFLKFPVWDRTCLWVFTLFCEKSLANPLTLMMSLHVGQQSSPLMLKVVNPAIRNNNKGFICVIN